MPEAEQEEQQGGFLRTALQSLGLFLLVQYGLKYLVPSMPKAATTTSDGNNATIAAVVPTTVPAFERDALWNKELEAVYNPIPQHIAPIWPTNTSLDLYVFVSPSIEPPSLSRPGPAIPVVQEKGFQYGSYQEGRDVRTTFSVPKAVQHNGTLWGHFFVGKSGSILDPADKAYNRAEAYHFIRPLNQFLKRKKAAKVRNLLSDTPQAGEEDEADDKTPQYASYFHPNFTISFVPDLGTTSWTQMHPGIREWIHLESTKARDVSGQNGWYYPILYLNTFWQLRDHMTEINDTVAELPLNLHLNELSNWKFNILASMDFGFKQQAEKAARGESTPGGGDGSEIEEIKRILLDSNLYLLGTTVVVGILHTIFEMLAFKNDVSHWRNKKDNVGVSVRTILANVFMQAVIFLYLMDNNDNTSWMILLGQGMGILIEAWKITKTVDVRVRATNAETTGIWRYLPYEIKFEDKHKLSDLEKETQQYDEIAFQYMYYIAVPLILAYAGYSLYYESHKSWYSFVITTLVGSVYAYGFLLMLPSLYINYRLQSVAHMPGKAMTYKVLSTFIDDLFAFTIKMPTLHRLATLRDDVVFFVYVYQSWKYKIDYGRVNEFGQGGEEDAEVVAEKKVEVANGVKEAVEGVKGKVEGAQGNGKLSASGSEATGGKDAKKRR